MMGTGLQDISGCTSGCSAAAVCAACLVGQRAALSCSSAAP